MNKYLLLIFLAGLFSAIAILPTCSASIGTFRQSTDVNLIQTCNNCTYCNLTKVTAPDSTVLQINQEMTKDITSYNFTLSLGNTSQLGDYKFCYDCGNDEENMVGCVSFIVTSTGLSQTTSQGISSAIYLVLMIVLTVMFSYLSIRLFNSDRWWILGIFFGFFSFILLFYDVWLGYEYHRALTGMSDSGVPEVIFYIFTTLIIVGFLASLGLLFLKWKQVFKYIKREVTRKEEKDEDMNYLDNYG